MSLFFFVSFAFYCILFFYIFFFFFASLLPSCGYFFFFFSTADLFLAMRVFILFSLFFFLRDRKEKNLTVN